MKPPKVGNNKGRCIIRWVYKEKAHSLTWGDWASESDRIKLELCGKMIFQDCLIDQFDSTQSKYRFDFRELPPLPLTD